MSDIFESRKDCPTVRKANKACATALLDDILEPMRIAARGCGYALALHGSLSRDIDLVAIPWTSDPYASDDLLTVLCGVIAGFTGRACSLGWSDKPHGRKATTITHTLDCEIDLSVIPFIPK